MKALFKVSPALTVELEASTQKELFEQLATWQEIFGIDKCGKCGKLNLKFVVRNAKKGDKSYQYPELHCKDCYARLAFGTHDGDKGTLFPKRKDGDEFLPDNGWTRWDKETGKRV